MDFRFRKAEYGELADCIALANQVFEIDFRTFMPKVYGEHPCMQAAHYVADNGEPGGLVSVMREHLTVGETVLKTGYVGSVCVHPNARGQGLMRELMHLANSDMTADGTDIAFLNGSRQRYQYYGFVPAGATYFFHVAEDNAVHALGDVSAGKIRFEEIDSGSVLEGRAREIYYSKPVHFERKEFASVCRTSYEKPFAVLDNGEFIGYVVTNGDKNCWAEVCVGKEEHLDLAIKAWMEQNKVQGLQIMLPEWENGLRRHLVSYASGMSHGYSVQARIFRFKRVVEAYLKVKARTSGITDGCMSFDVDGERFKVTVENGNVSVCEGGEEPLELTAYEANRLMLLPFPFEGMPVVPKDWFPLGISIAPSAPDSF